MDGVQRSPSSSAALVLPCDVFLAAHASAYGGVEKIAKARAGAKPNPFIDPDGYQQAVARSERAFLAELTKQSAR